MALAVGQLLQNRYRILRLLGQGGMGAVYQVLDTRLGGKPLAMKEMSDAALLDPAEKAAASAAFRQEAELLANLDHPNIPKVSDFFTEGGKHYIVMEFVPGETLEHRLARQGTPCSEQEVRAWAWQLGEVLTYLHSQNPAVIFRDLKPGNIMLTPQGQVKLIDFGIARFFKPGKTGDTQQMGTPGYAPPEQYGLGQQSDARSDIYSLGVVLHEALTRHDPATTPFKLPPVRQLNPTVSADLEQIIARATQTNESLRYQDAAELLQALSAAPSKHTKLPAVIVTWPILSRTKSGVPVWVVFAVVMMILGVIVVIGTLNGGKHPARTPVPVTPNGVQAIPTLITMGNVARLSEFGRLHGRAQQLAFTPDGQTLALTETDGAALWNLRTVSQTGFITTPMPSAVAFSPDGRWLLVDGKENILELWDVLSHNMLAAFEGHTAMVTDVVFDMTGRLAASSSEDKSVRVWDMVNHSELNRFEGHTDWVMGVAFSSNGGLLASAGRDALVQLWNVGSGTLVWSFRGHEGSVSSIAINPDGKLLVSGGEDSTIRLWDIQNHTLVRILRGHLGGVTSVTFSPDGKLVVSSSRDGTVRLWDAETGIELRTLKGHSGEVLSMSFAPPGNLIASAGNDGIVILWGVR